MRNKRIIKKIYNELNLNSYLTVFNTGLIIFNVIKK